MSQIERLTAYLTDNMPPRALQFFESEIDDGRLIYAYKDLGLNQRRLGLFRYTAVLSWDRFPFRLCPPALVYALIFAWLKEYRNELYDECSLAEPSVDIEFDTDEAGSLMISIELADAVNICRNEAGEIPFSGHRWQLTLPEFNTAIRGSLFTTAADSGAPLGGEHEA